MVKDRYILIRVNRVEIEIAREVARLRGESLSQTIRELLKKELDRLTAEASREQLAKPQ